MPGLKLFAERLSRLPNFRQVKSEGGFAKVLSWKAAVALDHVKHLRPVVLGFNEDCERNGFFLYYDQRGQLHPRSKAGRKNLRSTLLTLCTSPMTPKGEVDHVWAMEIVGDEFRLVVPEARRFRQRHFDLLNTFIKDLHEKLYESGRKTL